MRKFLLFILIILCVFLLTKNFILKVGIEQGVGLLTGLRLQMQSLSLSFLKTHLQIKELKIYNPRGFEQEIMLDMPEILVDYNLGDILTGNIAVSWAATSPTTVKNIKNARTLFIFPYFSFSRIF